MTARANALAELHQRALARETDEQRAARIIGDSITGFALWLEHAPIEHH